MEKSSTEEAPLYVFDPSPKPSKYDISAVMAEMGREGGQIGGKRRLQTMTKSNVGEWLQRLPEHDGKKH